MIAVASQPICDSIVGPDVSAPSCLLRAEAMESCASAARLHSGDPAAVLAESAISLICVRAAFPSIIRGRVDELYGIRRGYILPFGMKWRCYWLCHKLLKLLGPLPSSSMVVSYGARAIRRLCRVIAFTGHKADSSTARSKREAAGVRDQPSFFLAV